jgi:hypothetical protein
MTWDKKQTAGGDWDIAKCLPTIRFECEHCAHPLLDGSKTKSEWNRTGRYRAKGEPNDKRKSFHWETVIDFPWDELVELWLEACNAEKRGDLKPKLQFYQKRRAMFMDEETLLKRGIHPARSAYVMTSDWPEEKPARPSIARKNLFWWTVRAWSNDKAAWLRQSMASRPSIKSATNSRSRKTTPLRLPLFAQGRPGRLRGLHPLRLDRGDGGQRIQLRPSRRQSPAVHPALVCPARLGNPTTAHTPAAAASAR